MEDAYIIRGGRPLTGEVQLSGAKNAALKAIIAALLFDGPVTLTNVPHIGDIEGLLRLINQIGGKARFVDRNEVIVDGAGLKKDTIDLLSASKTRASFMLFVPLLHRLGQANIPNPGGCRIGSRPIDRPVACMKQLGIEVNYDENDGYYKTRVKNKKIHGSTYTFDKPTHTGTEFGLLLACLAEGETILHNVCQEPEIEDLIQFLNQAGAVIRRKDHSLYIKGVSRLKAHEPYPITTDRNEAVTFALFGLATAGDVRVKPIDAAAMQTFIEMVEKAGAGVSIDGTAIRFFYQGKLRPTDITTSRHPGFMTDWQAPWTILMTQAEGQSTIHETVFENRFAYVEELKKLGAQIEYFRPKIAHPEEIYQFNWSENQTDFPQAIRIFGKTKLHNAVLKVNDLRAGASLLIAAAIADGESVVMSASVIDRGYEAIDKKLRALGAQIRKV